MRRRPPSAFSLVELVLAMLAGMAVLLVAAGWFGTTGERCGRVQGGVAARRELRFAVAEWRADLAAAVPKAGVVPGKSGVAGDRLGFFLLQAPGKQSEKGRIGDLCGVVYQVRDRVEDGRTMRCLTRGLRESAEAYPALKAQALDSLLAPRETDEPVAFGVVRFEARPVVRVAAGEWVDWSAGDPSVRPEAMAWRIEVARPELAKRLATPQDWDALAGERRASDERAIEAQAGVTAFGHEGAR
jgi:hypothetical protein